MDETVKQIKFGWYKSVEWKCFDEVDNEKREIGEYLICDGGYLSSKIKSVRKDVECVFGMLKKDGKYLTLLFGFMILTLLRKCL